MMDKKPFTIIELVGAIAVILLLIAIFFPMHTVCTVQSKMSQAVANTRDLITTMKMYGESNKEGHMPYPVADASATGSGPNGSVAWGESGCLSVDVAKLLIKENYIKQSGLNLFTLWSRSVDYTPLVLGVDQEKKDTGEFERWDETQELDFQIYASKNLTTTANPKKVLVISYDNQYLLSCLFDGKGWVIGYLGGKAEFKKNAWYENYDTESDDKLKMDVTNPKVIQAILKKAKIIEPSATDFKTRIPSSTAPGGGSTEIIGQDVGSGVYETLFLR